MVDGLRNFLKSFDNASKGLQIPIPKFKIEIGSTKSKDIDQISLNIKIEIFIYRSDFKTINFESLPSKSLGYTQISSKPQKLSTLTIATSSPLQ